MQLMLLLIFSGGFPSTYGHWMCMLANYTCTSENGNEFYSSHYKNTWVKVSSAEVYEHVHKTICSLLCLQIKCFSFLPLTDACVISKSVISPPENNSIPKLQKKGRNVALGKPTLASPEYAFHKSHFAVDGKVSASQEYYHSNGSTDPWLVVDLKTVYSIQEIRVFPRNDYIEWASHRFLSVQVLVGNTPSNDGDFSSYKLVTEIAGPNPDVFYWYIVKAELDRPYRYVALQRISGIGTGLLEVDEIEVYE